MPSPGTIVARSLETAYTRPGLVVVTIENRSDATLYTTTGGACGSELQRRTDETWQAIYYDGQGCPGMPFLFPAGETLTVTFPLPTTALPGEHRASFTLRHRSDAQMVLVISNTFTVH